MSRGKASGRCRTRGIGVGVGRRGGKRSGSWG